MSEPGRSIEEIYERYHQSLYRFCFSIVGNAEDAQDALQNAMLKALRALPGEEREIQLKPWLYRIAHNESIEILRRRREQVEIDPEAVASGEGPAEIAALRQRLRRLLADLAGLPERQRAALVMRELAGLEFEQIGAAFETSAAVARQTVYEARLSLQQMEAGREMSCDSVRRQISDGDGRVLRRRDIQSHLSSCPDCRAFRDSIEARRHDLAAIAPLPLAASTGILQALLGGAGGHTAAGAGAVGSTGAAGAGKAIATSALVKSVAAVAAVAVIGAGAADRSGLIHVGPSGGSSESTQGARAGGVQAGGAPGPAAPGQAAGGVESQAGGGDRSKLGVARRKSAAPTSSTASPGQRSQGPPATLPQASRHGQEAAAAHKASPHGVKAHGSPAQSHRGGHSGGGHSGSAGSGHSHSAAGQPGGGGSAQGATGASHAAAPREDRQPTTAEPPAGETEAGSTGTGTTGPAKAPTGQP